jgi:hypothetical protein
MSSATFWKRTAYFREQLGSKRLLRFNDDQLRRLAVSFR